MKYFIILFISLFMPVLIAYAHEEGATTLTTENTLGPLLAIIIIVLAIVAAKRIKKIKKENHYEQRN